MEQTILTDTQKKAISFIGKENNLEDFYLSGGTALAAYYFGHRFSDDLDFFSYKDPDKLFLHSFSEKLKTEINATSVQFEHLYDRNIFIYKLDDGELKVEFSKYPFIQLEHSVVKGEIRIDSLRDIVVNKLMALLDRFDPKDFVDMFFILKEFSMENLRTDVEKKFGIKVDNIFLGGELSKVKRIEALPKMIKEVSTQELKEYFSELAKGLSSKIFE